MSNKLFSKIFSNARKPEGFFGRMMVNGMNGGSHARMAQWGLSFIDVADEAHVLDIGCGGGANVARLLALASKGNVQGIDPHLVIPDTSKSVYDGCVQCWRGDTLEEWKNEFIRQAEQIHFPIFKPYYELTQAEKDILWHG